MLRQSFPEVIAVVDNSGLPLFTLPSADRFILVGSLVSILTSMSKTSGSGGIEYIRVEDGLIFIKRIDRRGNLLMFFKGLEDPRDGEWIVEVFINQIKDIISEFVEGFITNQDVEQVSRIYDMFINHLSIIQKELIEINMKITNNKKLLTKAPQKLSACSRTLLSFHENKIIIDPQQIRQRNLKIEDIRQIVSKCKQKIK